MPEPLRHDVDRLAGLQEQRRARMPESVELDPADVRSLDQPIERALAEVVRLQRLPEKLSPSPQFAPVLGKHQPEVVIRGPVPRVHN